ncbi:MAG: GtrA family protein [Hyphomicrobiales bacterium]|nr:GtrA family protein [Hyphomicrobiales bacterium]
MIPSQQFVLFGMIGVAGFLVDASVLFLIMGVTGLYLGRVFSFFCAAFVTWLMNRATTFRDRRSGHRPAKELVIYVALMLVGGSVNYLVYWSLISSNKMAEMNVIVAAGFGSLAGMAINLLTSRFVLYRFVQSEETAG